MAMVIDPHHRLGAQGVRSQNDLEPSRRLLSPGSQFLQRVPDGEGIMPTGKYEDRSTGRAGVIYGGLKLHTEEPPLLLSPTATQNTGATGIWVRPTNVATLLSAGD